MILIEAVKEVGESGKGYHLAVGKVIEVTEEEREKLEELYPGCFREYVWAEPKELFDRLNGNQNPPPQPSPKGGGGFVEEKE